MTSSTRSAYLSVIDSERGHGVVRVLALMSLAVSVVVGSAALVIAGVPFLPILGAFAWLGVLAFAGRWWLRQLRIECRGIEALASSLAIGLVAQTLAAGLLTATALRVWTPVFVVIVVLSALPEIARLRHRQGPVNFGPLEAAFVVLLAVVVTIEAVSGYFAAIVPRPDGTVLVQLWPADWDFHLALTSEVRRQFPPELPFFAGRPMNYHYFIDLLMVGLADVTGTRLVDAVAIVQPFAAWALLLSAALALLVRIARSVWVAIGGAVTVAFVGGTFTIVPGLALLGPTKVWEHAFHAQPTVADFTVNPAAIAIGFLLCGLLLTSRWLDGHGLRYALVGGSLIGVAAAFKVFVGLTAFGGLGIAALVAFARDRDTRLVPPLVAGGAAGLPLIFPFVLRNAESGQLELTLQPAYFTIWSLDYMGLADPAKVVDEVVRGVRMDPLSVLLAVALTFIILVAGAGYRVMIIRRVWRDLGAEDRSRRLWTVLAWGVVVGTVMMLLFRLLPRDFPQTYNQLGFSYHVSLVFAGFYAAAALVEWRAARRLLLVAIMCAAWVAGAVSLGQFFVAQAARGAVVLPTSEVAALTHVRDRTPTDAVFIVPVRLNGGGYPWVERIGERRVVLGADWAIPHVPKSEIDERALDVARFYESPLASADVLERLGVDYVFVTPAESNTGEQWRSLRTSGQLESVFDDGGFTVLRVVRRDAQ